MSNTVNLTPRQQKFFDYFNDYHRTNGVYPTMSQGSRDMKCCASSITNMYGALLLKGAFTDGKTIVAGNKPRRNASSVKAVNLMEVRIDPVRKVRKANTPKIIAEKLSKLIMSGDPAAKRLAEILGL